MAQKAVDRTEVEAALKRAARVAVSGTRDARAGKLLVRTKVKSEPQGDTRSDTANVPSERDR